jgi:hypothetical protein
MHYNSVAFKRVNLAGVLHMEADINFANYAAARRRIGPKLAELGLDLEAWLQEHAQRMPSIADVARLEAMHMQRQELLQELQEAEERFIDHAISTISAQPGANKV